jgi:hypothetical protein
MNDLAEIVDLPDRSVQPLVHPLDLAEAAGPYRLAWLIELLTGPPIGLAIGALIWALTGNLFVGLIAAVPVVAVGTYASRNRRDDAWAFIPRNRQDRERVLPDAWELGAGIVDGVALVVAAALIAVRLGQTDISIGIREFSFGAGVAAVALVALDLGSSLATGRGTFVGRPWFAVPILVALVVAVVIVALILFAGTGLSLTLAMLLGAASVLVAGAVYLGWRSISRLE